MYSKAYGRKVDGKFAPAAVLNYQHTSGGEDSYQGYFSRKEAAALIHRSQRQLAYYHKLLALHSEPYKIPLARKMGKSKPKYKQSSGNTKANGLLYLIFQGKPVRGWVIDLKKPLRKPQIVVLRRVKDLFDEKKTEPEVINWIQHHEHLIFNDLKELIDEYAREFATC